MRRVFAEEASRYHAAGVNVLPIAPGTKRPPMGVAWRPWQTRRQTAEDLGRLLTAHPDGDVAVILGGPGGLVDIETDGPAGERAVREERLPVPPTAMFTSRRGVHRLYRCASPLCTRRGLRPQLDVLAANSYVVVPTSTGRAWLTPGWLEAVALLPEAWVEVLATAGSRGGGPALAEAERTGVEAGRRNTTLAALVGRWLTQGVPEADVLQRARRFAARCTPPLDGREAEQVVASVLRTRARGRSPERAAWLLAKAHGLRHPVRSVFVGLVVMWGELGCAGPEVAAPHRLVADYAGVDRDAVGPALRRLEEFGLIVTREELDSHGRRVTVARLNLPTVP